MSRFTDILLVSPLTNGRTWVIRKDFGYDVGHEGSDDVIDVPIGFTTDFASIPRIFWSILPQWGKYGNAAIIHDYLYFTQTRTRKEADDIFWEAMGVCNVPLLTMISMYLAVRLFGYFAWKGHQKRGITITQ